MTISSSLAAGVSGLNANSQRLASISDNIANSGTYGYKRTFTDFHSMVIDSTSSSKYIAGGVRTTTERLIDEKGAMQGTANATDISIKGRGFLPVTDASAVKFGGNLPLSLMTTASFRPDAAGTLVDATGKVLLGSPANQDGTIRPFPRDSIAGLEPVNIYHNQLAANPTGNMTMHVNLPANDTRVGAVADPQDITLEYFGNLGQTETLRATFTPTPSDGVTPSNEWTMTITDSASGDAVIGEYTLAFNSGNPGGGTLASVTRTDPAYPEYEGDSGTLPLTVGGGDISLNIGKLNNGNGITQLNTSFSPTTLSKDGSAIGNLVGVEIDAGGIVNAVYDSGFTRSIYQVPVIDVANPNGLRTGDAQTYKVTAESGEMFLWDAGDGPVGETAGYSRETSTVDVATELTNLIQTQRAYSSNAKIIQTVDEMLQETTNLKR
ncbi:flagellar hook-basal body complex protein [Palleronia sp. LCG004]|uniref:flagellar hook protein FlgE n=1 Tax=Palleronia sp. LCG004 TaxID=3079304 RepID=UPI002943391F|nr:flagellar hook-basal body complex protein [Palleronia sp. LCG004]WOI56328.1 flagellar hook-basal body complex protein [Palleronia sp. LCG004]